MVCQATALFRKNCEIHAVVIGGHILTETTNSSYCALAQSQVARENANIESIDRQQSAEEILDELRKEAEIAKLDVAADLAQLLDSETSPLLRKLFAARYQRFTGIHPDDRET